MERIAAVPAIVFVGGLIALQPPVNSQLARYTTVLAASFIDSSTRRRSTDRALSGWSCGLRSCLVTTLRCRRGTVVGQWIPRLCGRERSSGFEIRSSMRYWL